MIISATATEQNGVEFIRHEGRTLFRAQSIQHLLNIRKDEFPTAHAALYASNSNTVRVKLTETTRRPALFVPIEQVHQTMWEKLQEVSRPSPSRFAKMLGVAQTLAAIERRDPVELPQETEVAKHESVTRDELVKATKIIIQGYNALRSQENKELEEAREIIAARQRVEAELRTELADLVELFEATEAERDKLRQAAANTSERHNIASNANRKLRQENERLKREVAELKPRALAASMLLQNISDLNNIAGKVVAKANETSA